MAGERGGLSRLLRAFVACTAGLAVVGVAPPGVDVPVAEAASGFNTCTEGGVTWKADWTHQTDFGGIVKIDALWRTEAGTTASANNQIWQLRWDNDPGQWSPNTPPASVVPFQQTQGTFTAVGNTWRSIFLSPRLVTPDGACTIYLTPFVNILGPATGPRVAVLGDDLLQQLNDSTYNGGPRFQGYVEGDLNAQGVRVEVEGQGVGQGVTPFGRRWTDAAGTSGLAKADSYLLDEFRGLLEHDPDGFVVGAGVNDALYVAAGATATDRNNRMTEVTTKLGTVAGEMVGRTGCLVAVTVPEGTSSLDPEYAWAAKGVNDWFRWVAAAGGTTDTLELVDFALQATGQPWFQADGIHLNAAGITGYRNAIGQAVRRCSDSVVRWGKPGTLGDGIWANKSLNTTGQAVRSRAVPGWDFVPGMRPWFSTITTDGTMFFMNARSAGNVFVSSGEGMHVTAFHPDNGTFQNIPIRTDRNVAVPTTTDGLDPDNTLGADQGDVDKLLINGGNAVAFTGYQLYLGQDLTTQGQFPIFGVVTKAANGTWEVKQGPDGNGDGIPDWRNAWSGNELYAAAVASGDADAIARADEMCPEVESFPGSPIARTCGPWVNEMAVLPATGDVVVTQYGTSQVSVLDVSNPDASGRINVKVKAVYDLPAVHDPAFPADPTKMIDWTVREVQADPTSTLNDERFGISPDFAPGLIELRYNPSAAPAQRIVPVSAPVLSGEITNGTSGDPPLKAFIGYGQFHYDYAGNLWTATSEGFNDGFGVKVYEKTPTGRKITKPECLETVGGQPKPLVDYVATASGTQTAWGKVCQPDYNILAQEILGATWGVDEDPVTHNMVFTNWPHGQSIVIDPDDPTPGGTALDMTFKVGNPVALSIQGTTTQQVSGPCASNPATTCTSNPTLEAIQGMVDRSGRMWVMAPQGVPGLLKTDHPSMQILDQEQWVYSVDLSRLMGREPQRLSAQAGQVTVVQGEVTKTVATTQANGTIAVRNVDAVAGVGGCTGGCNDGLGLAGGYAVGDEVDGGLPANTVVEYRINVPKTGTYQLAFRAADRGVSGPARIRLTLDGGAPQDTATFSNTSMGNVTGPTLSLSAGAHTIQLTSPTAATAGWQLDWMKFTRS